MKELTGNRRIERTNNRRTKGFDSMEEYEGLEIEVVEFDNEDVITTSTCPPHCDGDICDDYK